ncbi:transposase [Candidatus Bathyarchaeota archaeon]|nr:transposase [Candidatus Bathyarchaeota archaeon]
MSRVALLTSRRIMLNSRSVYHRAVEAVKAVSQNYVPSEDLLVLLNEFRKMVNDCIRIGLTENVTSMKSLSLKAYHQLERYKMPTCYRLTAISKTAGILRNYRRTLRKNLNAKKPYASKLMLTDCYAFQIVNNQLRLSLGDKNFVFIQLNKHTLAAISGFTMKSVSLTASTLSIAFSKEMAEAEITGLIGIDRNLDNISIADSNGAVQVFDLSRATVVKENCRQAKRGFRRNDHRIAKWLHGKYGRIQRNKVGWVLHNASAKIVQQAKDKQFGIVMENLRGIRKLYRKGNWQGKDYRARMNSWSFYEFQRQIEYKAKWEGIPVIYVHPAKTSSTCAICGSEITECAERKVYCHKCNKIMDRDENAALNIVKRGVRFAPSGFAEEAVRGNGESLILRVDANQLTSGGK